MIEFTTELLLIYQLMFWFKIKMVNIQYKNAPHNEI